MNWKKKGVVFNKLQDELEYPAELIKMFQENPELKQAFEKLTPGRKRSYLIHFNSAKQSQTIENRIKKCIPKILMGKGFNEY
ncbi:MAG: hypothetical protein KatS3mg027_1787 [Bacteroidia bacterium]|nr:MAG: hypothetical protein KatS3mg027_1787 [Bacteroidia bacterium]